MSFLTTATLAMAIDGNKAKMFIAKVETARFVCAVADWDETAAHYWGTADDWAAANANALTEDEFMQAMKLFDASRSVST
jgi:hypothetical protein